MKFHAPLRELRAKRLKTRLIAASLTWRQYLTLRNTVRVLRFSGASLNAEQQEKLKEFEAVVTAYQEAQPC